MKTYCQEVSTKYQCVFTLRPPEVPLPAREGEDTLENTEIYLLEVRRLKKELDPQKDHGADVRLTVCALS